MKPLSALLLAFLLFAGPAFAQNCAPRTDITAKLTEVHGESLRFGGLQKARGTQTVLEVWVSAETDSFTVLMTHPNGISCIMAVGTDFFEAVPAQEPAGNPL